MTSNAQTRVMPVDGHSIMRDLLRDALENTGEFQAAARAADGADKEVDSVTDLEPTHPPHPWADLLVRRCWNH